MPKPIRLTTPFLGILLLCLATAPASVLANPPAADHGRKMCDYQGMGHHASSRRGHAGAMSGKGLFARIPVAILHQREPLGLAEDQVQKLRAIYAESKTCDRKHEGRKAIQGQMDALLSSGQIDPAAYQAALEAAAKERIQARVETAQNAQEALQILTQEQRTLFLYSVRLAQSRADGHGGKHHGYGRDHGCGKSHGHGKPQGEEKRHDHDQQPADAMKQDHKQ